MRILVNFQPNRKFDYYEGSRLRKTIKNALEVTNTVHVKSKLDEYDVVHLIAVDNDIPASFIKERNAAVVVSACYAEDDSIASYLEYKVKDGKLSISLKPRTIKFLNSADLITVPSINVRDLLVNFGVNTQIKQVLPGINFSRFDFSRNDEKELFYRYSGISRENKLVISIGSLYGNLFGFRTLVNITRKNPNVSFFFLGSNINRLTFKGKRILKSAPRNLKFLGVVPDDIYRSALLNADILFIPGYRKVGVISLFEAMAAKCQIIARKQAIFEDIIINGFNGYVGEFSETLEDLMDEAINDSLDSTVNKAYKYVKDYSLENFGKTLHNIYSELIKNKESK